MMKELVAYKPSWIRKKESCLFSVFRFSGSETQLFQTHLQAWLYGQLMSLLWYFFLLFINMSHILMARASL